MNKKTFLGILLGIMAAVLVAVIVILSVKFFFPAENPSSGETGTEIPAVEAGILEIGKASGKPGDEVTVPVTFKENPGVWAISLMLGYDETALTYVEYTEGDIFDEYDVYADSGMFRSLFNASGITNVKGNGNVVDITFKINEDAQPGDYELTITDGTNLCDEDEASVLPKLVHGNITVE